MQKYNADLLPEIAIRIYQNDKHGSTYAKGKRHSVIFNASADIKDPKVKYLLDFQPYDTWQHTARSDEQMEILKNLPPIAKTSTLLSWVQRYNVATKEKTMVYGVCLLEMTNNSIELLVVDNESGIRCAWELPTKQCRQLGKGPTPLLLATNSDLDGWQKPCPTTSNFAAHR